MSVQYRLCKIVSLLIILERCWRHQKIKKTLTQKHLYSTVIYPYFNDIVLSENTMARRRVRWRREWGTMAAVGGGDRHGRLIHVLLT